MRYLFISSSEHGYLYLKSTSRKVDVSMILSNSLEWKFLFFIGTRPFETCNSEIVIDLVSILMI